MAPDISPRYNHMNIQAALEEVRFTVNGKA
jgi:hypothetical protein